MHADISHVEKIDAEYCVLDVNRLTVARCSVRRDALDIVLALRALDAMYAELDGREWNSNTLENIAELLTGAGYKIREP